MTNRATLEALLARVLEGTGPDQELDLRIARELFDSEPLGHAAGMKDEMLLASVVSWPHYTKHRDVIAACLKARMEAQPSSDT